MLNIVSSKEIEAIAVALGGEARLVGGSVRDLLLGREIKDVDMATPLPPEKVMTRLGRAGIRVIPTGIKHGTVTAVFESGNVEITTLRRDVSCDGRWAQVEFTDDWRQDSSRRDFTINAMYMDMEGKVYDYFGGQKDLASGKVRFIGEAAQRIKEDYLRILRFFRFTAWYSKGLDEEGFAACVAEKAGLTGLSAERVRAEMEKILISPRAAEMIALMHKSGITEAPGLAVLERLQKLEEKPDFIRRLIASGIKGIMLSNREKERAEVISGYAERDLADKAAVKKLARRFGKEAVFDMGLLKGGVDLAWLVGWEIPVFPVTGEDLKALGWKEGRVLGEKLRALEEEWEKGGYKMGREELLAKK